MSNNEHNDIWVYAEQQNGKLMNVTLEILGEGTRLKGEIDGDCKVCAVLIGSKLDNLITKLYEYGADAVYIFDREFLSYYNEDGYAKVFADAIEEYKPEIVLFGATRMGNELASRVAAEARTGVVSNCMRLDIDNGNYLKYLENTGDIDLTDIDISTAEGLLKQTRAGKDGLMDTLVTAGSKPQMATISAGVMDKNEQDASRRGELMEIKSDITKGDIRVDLVSIVEKISTMASLTDAEIVCAGGRGLGDAEGLKLMEEFAKKVGGAVGTSRFVVDSGWTDVSHQVGQSGTYVKPKIYFACGISGAIQHLVGMQNSDVIVAINKNPDAPMMKAADFAICDDLYKIIPEIIAIWDDFQ